MHTDACRKRMEAAVPQDPAEQERVDRFLSRHLERRLGHKPPTPTASAGVASAPAGAAPSTSAAPLVIARQAPVSQGGKGSSSGGAAHPTGTKRPPPGGDEVRTVKPKESPPPAPKRKHDGGGDELEEAGMEAEVVHGAACQRGKGR